MCLQVSIAMSDYYCIGAINLLDIERQLMLKKRIRYDVNVLMPRLMSSIDINRYLSKQGDKIEYYYPEIVELQSKKQE